MDKNYDLKITDFGLSGPLEGRLIEPGLKKLTSYCGTKGYMAPEIKT